MAQIKFFEVRDRATYIPTMAVKLDGITTPEEEYMLRRAGFGNGVGRGDKGYVYLVNIDRNSCQLDPFKWGDRTMQVAHEYIQRNFDAMDSGDVVDVEFILGESTTKKRGEMYD